MPWPSDGGSNPILFPISSDCGNSIGAEDRNQRFLQRYRVPIQLIVAGKQYAYLLAGMRQLRSVYTAVDQHIKIGTDARDFFVQNSFISEALKDARQLRFRFRCRHKQRRTTTATSAMATQPASTFRADEQISFQQFGVVLWGNKNPAIPGFRCHAPEIMTCDYPVICVMYAASRPRDHVERSDTSMHFRVVFTPSFGSNRAVSLLSIASRLVSIRDSRTTVHVP